MDAGFREIAHTADWELEVWAPDLPALLEQAARGMYALSGARLALGERARRRLELGFQDGEAALVQFLNELLFLGEQEGLAFDSFDLRLEEGALHASLEGATMVGLDKEIKAVTYHRLRIQTGPDGLRTRIVFDV